MDLVFKIKKTKILNNNSKLCYSITVLVFKHNFEIIKTTYFFLVKCSEKKGILILYSRTE